MRVRALVWAWLVGWITFLTSLSAAALEPPELRFEGPAETQAEIDRLERDLDRSRILRVMALAGLREPGPPIRVVLAPAGSAEAERVPEWVAGYAIGNVGLVVLLPDRVPSYPDRSLDNVLVHEIAHVLVARAARRRPVPRWLDEGLAVAVGRFGLEDRGRLIFATLRPGSPSLDALERSFPAGPGAAARAYSFSGAWVRWLMDRWGHGVVAEILDGLGRGQTVSDAFAAATGTTLVEAEAQFWRQITIWNKWVPLIGSSTFLWVLISTLALVAFYRRRQRDAEMLARWDAEEVEALQTTESSGEWVN